MPLFTSPTLNISGIEVDNRGFKCLGAETREKRAKGEFGSVSFLKLGLPFEEGGPLVFIGDQGAIGGPLGRG